MLELHMHGTISHPGMINYPHRVRQEIDVAPIGNFCREMAPKVPANRQSANGSEVSAPYGAISTRGIAIFIPTVAFVDVINISDSGMGLNPPRVLPTPRVTVIQQ